MADPADQLPDCAQSFRMIELLLLSKQLRYITRFEQQVRLTAVDDLRSFQREVDSSARGTADGGLSANQLPFSCPSHKLAHAFPALIVGPPTAAPNLMSEVPRRKSGDLQS